MVSIILYKSKVGNHLPLRGNFIAQFVILLLQRNKYWTDRIFLSVFNLKLIHYKDIMWFSWLIFYFLDLKYDYGSRYLTYIVLLLSFD